MSQCGHNYTILDKNYYLSIEIWELKYISKGYCYSTFGQSTSGPLRFENEAQKLFGNLDFNVII